MPCDTSLLKSIDALCGEGSAPDIRDVVYLIPDESTVVPFPDFEVGTFNIAVDIFAVGKHFESWAIMKTKNGFDAGTKGDGDGHYFEPKLEFQIAKLTALKSFILAKARGRRLTIVFTDNNGNKRIMRHAIITFDETTKSENGYKVIAMVGPVADPIPFYTGTLPLA